MPNQLKAITSFAGKVIRKNAEVLIIFKVKGKYYPANSHNCDVMDAYIHTGNPKYLNQFKEQMEF